MTKTFPGEFSRHVGKWKRGMIADITQLTRGVRDANGKEYLPSVVLDDRPPKTIRVTACSASENMLNTLDDAWVCWKDSNGILVASEKLNYTPTQAARRSMRTNASTGGDGTDGSPNANRPPGTPQNPISETGSFEIINPKHIPDEIWTLLQKQVVSRIRNLMGERLLAQRCRHRFRLAPH